MIHESFTITNEDNGIDTTNSSDGTSNAPNVLYLIFILPIEVHEMTEFCLL